MATGGECVGAGGGGVNMRGASATGFETGAGAGTCGCCAGTGPGKPTGGGGVAAAVVPQKLIVAAGLVGTNSVLDDAAVFGAVEATVETLYVCGALASF